MSTQSHARGDADPRGRDRPRGDRGRGPGARRGRASQIDWDRVEAGGEVIAKYGTAGPRAGAPVDPQARGRAEGPDHDADRRGLPLAPTSRCARTSTSTPACGRCRSLPGVDDALRGRRPDRRAREHRGPLLRPRAPRRARAWSRASRSITERACLRIARYAFALAERQGRKQGHRRPQGQHHEALGRPLPRVLPARRARPPRHRVRRGDRRQLRDAARARPDAVRRAAAREPLRRHPVGPRAPASSADSASCPGANIGDDVAVFEAVHGSAPDIAGKGSRTRPR